MAPNETVLLKSTLEISNKPYIVKLTTAEIYWEATSASRAASGPYSEPLVNAENQSVKLSEVVAVRLGDHGVHSGTPVRSRRSQNVTQFQNLEMTSLNPLTFTLWAVKRCSKHRWRHRKVLFSSKDASVVQQWVEKIQHTLASSEYHRPKSLLVFVNPVGGKRRAPKIYDEKVAPLFELAGIHTDVIMTERQFHARDCIYKYDLSKIDGIISVGGDGTFTEVVAGLMTRTMRENGVDQLAPSSQLIPPEVRIGIIPAGSTDTVCYTSVGINDPITAALHIVTGDSLNVDLGTVFHGSQFIKYNVSMMAYGYFGDCILDGERNRWMGPKRYDWAGLKKVVSNNSYEGELSYLPSPDKESNPRDKTFCKAGCQVCATLNSPERELTINGGANGDMRTPSDEPGWQRIKGRFMALNAFIMACRSRFAEAGPAPAAHLGDGCVDLVVIHECTRMELTKHLVRTMNKKSDQFDLPFVQVLRVREFRFRALTVEDVEDAHEASNASLEGQQRLRSRGAGTSVWNCDGEVVDEPNVEYRSHRQVLKLFARGVEDEIYEEDTTCAKCSCLGRT